MAEATDIPIERLVRASQLFWASRDFLLSWEVLERHAAMAKATGPRIPFPVRSQPTCAALALELALKARLELEGKEAPRAHSAAKLFGLLSKEAQDEIMATLKCSGAPMTRAALDVVLAEFEGTWEGWRYMHEHTGPGETVRFAHGNMYSLIIGIHQVLVALRPDWEPWPGVIQG